MKVVEHKKLSNVHVGSFSSCYEKSKVIVEILICPQFKNLNFFELDLILQTVLVKSLVSIQNQPGTLKYILQLIKLCTTFVLVEFCAQFKFWANFTKLQTDWMRIATVFGRGGALPPGQSRLRARRHAAGHAAACCCASRGRPHPHHLFRRLDKAPSGRSLLFLFFELNADELPAPLKFASPVAIPSHLSTPAAPP